MKEKVSTKNKTRLKEYDKPLMVAAHFGFVPIDTPKVSSKDVEITSDCGTDPHYSAAEKAAFIRHYLERDLTSLPHPLGAAYKRGKSHHIELVGFAAGLAEAVLIRTALSMLIETGHKHMMVELNCIGDKDSITTYEKELHNYLRKAGADLPGDFRKELKKDIFNLLRHTSPETEDLRERAPTSIAFLSTHSRNYFKEVLEYIEALDIEFRLAPELLGDKNYCSHTIFNIRDTEADKSDVLAVGYSYHRLGKRFGLKKEVTLSGATVFTEPRVEAAKKTYKELPKPRFYLIQLGREAKMRTLSTLELLRREKIAVQHVLGKDKLAIQLTHADSMQMPYLLIIGQKEALENTVTVRNVSTRAQETVPLLLLPQYLKTISL